MRGTLEAGRADPQTAPPWSVGFCADDDDVGGGSNDSTPRLRRWRGGWLFRQLLFPSSTSEHRV